MKSISLNRSRIETMFYVLIWVLVFSVPYFNERNSGNINWNEVIKNWTHIVGFLALFVINVYFLVPRLLLKKKYLFYFGLGIIIIGLVITLNMIPHLWLPTNSVSGSKYISEGLKTSGMNAHMPKPTFMVFADNLIICLLIMGSGTTFKLMTKWLSEEKLRKDVEKEQLRTNLALLRHQVSPHFFMNTLNNIHSLIEIDTEKAQDAVVRLSTLMRYLLYDSAQNLIELKKEIEFINSFISLMLLRHSEEVDCTFVIPEQVPDKHIPPMLFISLLENAFKHGVRYPHKSFIYFELQLNSHSLVCIVKNSKHTIATSFRGEYSGIGLGNIKESLKLLYDNNFQLNILDKEDEFEVNLRIPI